MTSRKNGNETDVDCGGDALKCVAGQHCAAQADCVSGWCHATTCEFAPSCATILASHPDAAGGVYPLMPRGRRHPSRCAVT